MRAVDLIAKKRDGFELTYEELDFLISNYVSKKIPDYQISALLMAIYFNGMTDSEASNLAMIMRDSGDIINLDDIPGIKVDKHSTGGVGDKTTLVLAPLVASLGINFPKMSGRGLGHTGGTTDKLVSIKGYNVEMDTPDFINQIKRINIALIGQSSNLTPADKLLYSLRDVTATVPSIPLIASSIMSKKLASGSDCIALDVKVGNGAFMKNIDEAKKLAKLMIHIGKSCNKKVTAFLTNMNEPLGNAVGNSLEVIEAINTLNGCGPKDLVDLCLTIGSYLVVDANLTDSIEKAREMLEENINNKKGLDKFAELVSNQGGDSNYIYNIELFKKAKEVVNLVSIESGYVEQIEAIKIGQAAMTLGAGRRIITDVIDHAVGIVLNKKVGDYVSKGDVLAYIYTNGKDTDIAINMVKNAFSFSDNPVDDRLILDVIK